MQHPQRRQRQAEAQAAPEAAEAVIMLRFASRFLGVILVMAFLVLLQDLIVAIAEYSKMFDDSQRAAMFMTGIWTGMVLKWAIDALDAE